MITLEGNDLKILEINIEKEYIEVVDGETLFKGKIFEYSAENECNYGAISNKQQKIVLYMYTAEPLKKGYAEKKIIEEKLKTIKHGELLCNDKKKAVDLIYNGLTEHGYLKWTFIKIVKIIIRKKITV